LKKYHEIGKVRFNKHYLLMKVDGKDYRIDLRVYSKRLASAAGQQKLLTLMCCLATQSNVLLLDEPVAGVHPDMAAQILGHMVKLKAQGKTVVFIEHDIEAVRRIAEQVIVMDDGKIIASGATEAVLGRKEIIEAYLT
jgi:branched-chain amino acid transport system ATP-binding protein